MEDSIEVILQDYGGDLHTNRTNPVLSACTGALLAGLYGVWRLFTMPGFRKIPRSLKVPYLPSSKQQTLNTMKLLEGRTGRLADLGSGDGRLVFAASSAGFQCTGFEINSILVAYTRGKALWTGVPSGRATFVKKDFWKTDLSSYDNVTAFLAPGVVSLKFMFAENSLFALTVEVIAYIDSMLLPSDRFSLFSDLCTDGGSG
ncbi:adenine nucleotide translocase lysine N-methyltransferase isoform X2 [Scophthalmus maximus]|uniref:adenine nucleotide translocase lysine N-methyltransferase isoform X2 n=1 Tax=Scophthalmus maximus TaxID=52904 RepID=UPI001FA8582D|nr:adenine nucleotide translocase lysine N-methyltransferase isoform X2 [Scophthalmus maximus]